MSLRHPVVQKSESKHLEVSTAHYSTISFLNDSNKSYTIFDDAHKSHTLHDD